MSDLITSAVRRLRYDAKPGTGDYDFKLALARLLAVAHDGGLCDDDESGVLTNAEEVAYEYIRISDTIADLNDGVLR